MKTGRLRNKKVHFYSCFLFDGSSLLVLCIIPHPPRTALPTYPASYCDGILASTPKPKRGRKEEREKNLPVLFRQRHTRRDAHKAELLPTPPRFNSSSSPKEPKCGHGLGSRHELALHSKFCLRFSLCCSACHPSVSVVQPTISPPPRSIRHN